MKTLLAPLLISMTFPLAALAAAPGPDWRANLEAQLPLLGHRNWIVIADAAYPLQNAAGIETVPTGAEHLEVVKAVLQALAKTSHVRGTVFTDAELPFVPEDRAKGITALRGQLSALLSSAQAQSLPHEQIIGKLDEAGKTFKILLLKTKLTLPYTSVFIQLDCGYWSAEAESELRSAMAKGKLTKP